MLMPEDDNNMQQLVSMCEKIATHAHRKQTRKFGADKGKPYIVHPARMASEADSYLEECVCWLHDTIEDTKETQFTLEDHGVPDDVIRRVTMLSKIDEETYLDFILRCRRDPIARDVKLLDINDNLQSLKPGSLRDKYLMAIYILNHTV